MLCHSSQCYHCLLSDDIGSQNNLSNIPTVCGEDWSLTRLYLYKVTLNCFEMEIFSLKWWEVAFALNDSLRLEINIDFSIDLVYLLPFFIYI